jgi:hypothetical protein
MRRIITLSMAVLMTIGGMGVVFSQTANQEAGDYVGDYPRGSVGQKTQAQFPANDVQIAQQLYHGQYEKQLQFLMELRQQRTINEINRTKALLYPVR